MSKSTPREDRIASRLKWACSGRSVATLTIGKPRLLRSCCGFVTLVVALVPLTVGAGGVPRESPVSNRFCWPPNFAGVVAGTTNDDQVVRLLGAGAYRPNEDEGVRYYIDRRHSATLLISTYTDAVVGSISLAQGVDPSLMPAERKRAESRYFDPQEAFGNWHALKLGATKAEVQSNMGEPAKKEEAENTWTYEAACTCELPEYLVFHFRNDKVVRVEFSAPPG